MFNRHIKSTKRGERKTPRKNIQMLEKLQEAGERASDKTSEFSLTKQLGWKHETTDHGIKLNKGHVKAILHLKPPASSEELKSFRGAIQNIANFPPRFSEKTDRMGQLLKQKRIRNGPKENRSILKTITEIPRSAHLARDPDNIVITDAT